MPSPLRLLALALLLVPAAACGGNPRPHDAESQLRFGVQMAQRGLWSEAWFRFDRARAMGGANDPQVLNNLAVAAEALGRFDEALGYYRDALALAPGNSDLKNNYDRFVGFYEAFRAQADAAGDDAAAAPADATPAEPPADFGSAGPASPPGGGVVTEPLPIPMPMAPTEPPPSPTETADPSPDDDPPGSAAQSGGTHHG